MTWTVAFFSGYTNFATVAQTYLENDLAAPLPENSHGPTERQHKHAESRCLSPLSSMDDRWVNGGHAARLAAGNRYRYHTEGKIMIDTHAAAAIGGVGTDAERPAQSTLRFLCRTGRHYQAVTSHLELPFSSSLLRNACYWGLTVGAPAPQARHSYCLAKYNKEPNPYFVVW